MPYNYRLDGLFLKKRGFSARHYLLLVTVDPTDQAEEAGSPPEQAMKARPLASYFPCPAKARSGACYAEPEENASFRKLRGHVRARVQTS